MANQDDSLKVLEIKNQIFEKEKEYLALSEDLQALALEEIRHLRMKLDLAEQTTAQRKEAQKVIQEELEDLREQEKITTDKAEKAKLAYQIAQKEVEEQKKKLEILRSQGKEGTKEFEDAKESLKNAKEKVKQYDEQNKQLQKQNEALEKIGQAWKSITTSVDTITGGYASQIGNLFTINGLMTSFGAMVKDIVTANQQLASTTGKVMTIPPEEYKNLQQYGITIGDTVKGQTELYNSMSSFSDLSKTVQKDLRENALKMSNFGVDVSTTGKNFDNLTKSLGMNASQAIETNDKIAKAAIGAGIAPAKMLKEFGSAMPQLAAHGKNAVNVFIDLQKQSKALGMEMSTLMGIIGDGFDTFEGAAEKAGKLNAILGGDYLNSVEMLNATESERVEMLKRSFDASGKNWDSLDRFEKKAIAASLGIKDMNEANKMFGNSTVEMRAKMSQQAETQENLNKAMEAAADPMKQIQTMMYDLAPIAAKVAEGIRNVIRWVSEHKEMIALAIGVALVIKGIILLASAVQFVGSTIAAITGIMSAFAPAAAATGPAAAGSIAAIGSAAAAAAPGILALGAAMLLIGAGIGIAAFGMSYLVDSIAKLSGEQVSAAVTVLVTLVGVLGALALAFMFLAPTTAAAGAAFAAAAPGFWALGGALFLIGAAVGIAAWGMSKLVDSIGNLSKNSSALKDLAEGVMALKAALSLFAITSFSSVSGLLAVKAVVSELSDAVNKMPDSVEFTAKVNNFRTIGETIKIAGEKAPVLAPAKDFINAAKEYHIAQKDSKSADNDALVSVLKGISSAGKEKTSKGGETPVILRIENGPDLKGYILGTKASIF